MRTVQKNETSHLEKKKSPIYINSLLSYSPFLPSPSSLCPPSLLSLLLIPSALLPTSAFLRFCGLPYSQKRKKESLSFFPTSIKLFNVCNTDCQRSLSLINCLR